MVPVMHCAPICTEAEIADLVETFYARVRSDAQLGPLFAAHVSDWPRHLAKMVDFWSSALLRDTRYRGAPLPAHLKLPGLSAALFQHWLDLFRATTAQQPNAALRERADAAALHVARSLWHRYEQQEAACSASTSASPSSR
jgi:hemoglobin